MTAIHVLLDAWAGRGVRVTLAVEGGGQVWEEHGDGLHAHVKVVQQALHLVEQLLPDFPACGRF